MGSVFRKKVSRPIPKDAQFVERNGKRVARWKGRNGRSKTAPIILSKSGKE